VIQVALIDLVQVKNARHLWPDQFAEMEAAASDDPDDRLTFGKLADWCDENGEEVYGHAWRWLHERPYTGDGTKKGVQVRSTPSYPGMMRSYWLENLPAWVSGGPVMHRRIERDDSTLAAVVADLAYTLDAMKKELN
jgi:hypothetical protein